ncbi:MAG: hypothetical protein KDD58_06950 [Bdellovibrionales bacterium]|nr:hypothetical protein [Bdellovibrionales bacterium]
MEKLQHNGKVITCILPKGEALGLLKKLFDKGVTRANFAFARGFDVHDVDNPRTGIPDAVEKEIVTLIADDEHQGEELFDFIFQNGNINRPGGGLIYMSKIQAASIYELPKIQNSMASAEGIRPVEVTL